MVCFCLRRSLPDVMDYLLLKRTIWRKNNNLIHERRPYKGQMMTRHNRLARVQWATHHFIWRCVDWNNESRFAFSHADGRTRVYRRTNERYADCCLQERDRFLWGSLMVWGGIMSGQKTDLVVMQDNLTALRYIDDVLRPHVIPFLHNQGPGLLSNMTLQDPTPPWLHDSFCHKMTLTFFRGLSYLLICQGWVGSTSQEKSSDQHTRSANSLDPRITSLA